MHLWHDARYAARMLRASPAFFVTAVLTLALGIGATTAVFSVCDSLLWKPIPLPDLDSLAMVVGADPDNPGDWDQIAPADATDIQRDNTTFREFGGWQYGMANIVGAGNEPLRVQQALVTANFFSIIGIRPAIGRGFQPGEDQPGRDREVIFSDALWKRCFGADPAIVGKSVRLDDRTVVVTGVMPSSFDFPLATEIWTPLALTPEQRTQRRSTNVVSVARLKPGNGVPQAQAQVNSTAARLSAAYPDTDKKRQFAVWPARKFLVDRETSEYLTMLLGSVLFVLLIACVNVANLQFARATARLREIALRTALGANRSRVVVQLITESVLLSVCGGALGLGFAYWGMNAIKGGMPLDIQRYILGWKDIALDTRTLGFTLLAVLIAGVLAGLAPAWQCSRPNLTNSLKEGGRGSSVGGGRHALRNVLVAAEVALAVILLVGAGLMVRGFQTLQERGAELEPGTLLTLRLALTDNKYQEPQRKAAFYREVLEKISVIPGVRSATAATAMPYSGHSSSRDFTIEGRAVEPSNLPHAMYQVVSPNFFATLRVPLRAGRFLRDEDGSESPRVTVISERLAHRWWSNQSPIGKHIKIGAPDSKNPWLTIVGVVGELVHNPYDRQPRASIYLPYQQSPAGWMDLGIRTAGDPLRVAPAVTAAIRSVDAEQPITEMQTMEKSIHNAAIGLNYMAVLMGVFGAIALVLSAIGVYGVMAYLVSEQTHEIGIRLALGAARQNVLLIVFRRGMLTAAAGLAIGLPAAYGFARLMASLVYGISATDPGTFAGISLVLVAATALAVFVPAQRAMHIDPIVALRYE
ncbi:MAG: ABC transporter permease [Bryobacteraceae bacterium]|jgi:putative ABC transport system permease protein